MMIDLISQYESNLYVVSLYKSKTKNEMWLLISAKLYFLFNFIVLNVLIMN